MTAVESIVIGGGPAGAAAAITLARQGRRVIVLEREAETRHKICGEFVGGSALNALGELGVDCAALGAHPMSRMRIARRGAVVERRLPFSGMGISRRALDAALLNQAEASGADVRRGAHVRSASAGGAVTDDGDVSGGSVLLASGKHELRGLPRPLRGESEDLVGFKMHFRLNARAHRDVEDAVELILFDDAYVGLQRIEDGRANLCLLADRDRFRKAGSTWEGLLADLSGESGFLSGRLADAESLFPRPLSIHRVPYGYIYAADAEDGMFRLGDQLGVIPSFTGEGLGIALHSGIFAAQWIAAGGGAPGYHARIRRRIRPAIALASRLYRVGRTRAGQRALVEGARLFPALLGVAARATRIEGA